jgi:hypothetical protein
MAGKWRFAGWVCYDGKGADDTPISIEVLRKLLHEQHLRPTYMVRKCFRRGEEVQLSSPIRATTSLSGARVSTGRRFRAGRRWLRIAGVLAGLVGSP